MSEQQHHLSEKDKTFRLLSPSGDVTYVFSPASKNKEKTTLLAKSPDIFGKLIDTLPIGILVADKESNILSWNRTFISMFIQDSLDEVIERFGENYSLTIEFSEKAKVDVKDIIEANKPFVHEYQINDRVYKECVYPFYINDSLDTHIITVEDITDLKELENRVIASKKEAAKSDFLSKMSHELRTPLNGILGFSQLLELEHSLTDDQQMYIEEIIKGSKHLLSLINEILDLSRIESGILKISKEQLQVCPIIEECVRLVIPTATNQGIEITNHLNSCADQLVQVDPVRFRQIVLNLLDNAIKYNRMNGQIHITYECDHETIVIHIRDNGIGIPLEQQENIFKPFYRVGNSAKEGAGIGLSLVKQLLELMDGKIGLESREGEGSDFWISFPVARTIQKEVSLPMARSTVDRLSKMGEKRILYIEDNSSNIQLVKNIINKNSELHLITATTGEDGIQISKFLPIDLILLDIHLPDMTGFDVINELQSNTNTKKIPVIAVSASAMPEDIQLALSKGFKEYITKPIDVSSFISTILNTLNAKNK